MLSERDNAGISAVHMNSNANADTVRTGSLPFLPSEGGQLFENLSEERILTLCRRASLLHFEMILVPTLLVGTRIRPDLGPFFATERKSWKTVIALIVLGLAVIALPWVYAHTIMPNPCKPVGVKLGAGEDEMKRMQLEMRGCSVESMLLKYPFTLGCVLMVASLVFTILMDVMTRIMYCIYYSCGRPHWLLNLKRLLWRPLLLFWYSWIHRKMPSLKYSNDFHIIPCLYSPPSVMICWVYLVLILEMMLLSAFAGHPTIGVVLAYAMGELLLKFGNLLVDAPSNVEVVTQGEIKHWLPDGWSIGSLTIFDRLHEMIQDGKTQLHISMAELLSLEQLERRVLLARQSDRMEGDDSLDGVGVIELVYVVDGDLLVNIVSGKQTPIGITRQEYKGIHRNEIES